MSEITLATKHSIVSHLARGRTTQWIADGTGLPIASVRSIGAEHGAPDMGRLATAADELRRQLDKEATHPTNGAAAADSVDLLKAEAERVGAVKLVKRAEHVAGLLDQLRVDLKAAVKVWDADAAARAERQKKLDRLSELKAEADKLRAELLGEAKPKSTGDAKVIREWASASGVECPSHGRIPQTVRDLYAKAVK